MSASCIIEGILSSHSVPETVFRFCSMSNESADDQPLLSEELLEALRALGTVRSFPKHSVIVIEGEPAETLYIVDSGRLRVFLSDEEGREAELGQLGPGEYFGEVMLASRVRTASVKAIDACKLCLIGREQFEALLSERPDLAFHLIQSLIYRVKVLTKNVESLALMDVYGRVARLFRDAAVTDDAGHQYVPGLSQQKIAEKVGASRSMINRILKDLTTGGYIEVSREKIELKRALPSKW